MGKFIFEDNGNANISRLLRYAYDEDYEGKYVLNPKDVLWFAGGNGNIIKALNQYYDRNEFYLVYIDLVPDNNNTYREYDRLQKYIKDGNFSNIHILPIRCIEYYVLRYLSTLDESLNPLVNVVEYRKVSASKNLEHFYKEVLLGLSQICKRPGGEEIFNGTFYRDNCLCNQKSELCTTMDRMEKAWG